VPTRSKQKGDINRTGLIAPIFIALVILFIYKAEQIMLLIVGKNEEKIAVS
jgi:hypothetical protein